MQAGAYMYDISTRNSRSWQCEHILSSSLPFHSFLPMAGLACAVTSSRLEPRLHSNDPFRPLCQPIQHPLSARAIRHRYRRGRRCDARPAADRSVLLERQGCLSCCRHQTCREWQGRLRRFEPGEAEESIARKDVRSCRSTPQFTNTVDSLSLSDASVHASSPHRAARKGLQNVDNTELS